MLSSTGLDIMLLLDCYLPTRFRNKKAWYRERTATGSMEIIATGQRPQRPDGIVELKDGFTEALLENMDEIIERVNGTIVTYTDRHGVERMKKSRFTRRKPFSIPQLLQSETKLSANPYRIWLSKTNLEKTREGAVVAKKVFRFRMDPDMIRATKKISFVRDCIMDTTTEVDEGYADDETETAIDDEAMFV